MLILADMGADIIKMEKPGGVHEAPCQERIRNLETAKCKDAHEDQRFGAQTV